MLMKVSKDMKRKAVKNGSIQGAFKKCYFHKRSNDVYWDWNIAFPTDHVHSFANGNIFRELS